MIVGAEARFFVTLFDSSSMRIKAGRLVVGSLEIGLFVRLTCWKVWGGRRRDCRDVDASIVLLFKSRSDT